jgi:hypothetical protein
MVNARLEQQCRYFDVDVCETQRNSNMPYREYLSKD